MAEGSGPHEVDEGPPSPSWHVKGQDWHPVPPAQEVTQEVTEAGTPPRELPPPPAEPERVILPTPPVHAGAARASGGCLTTVVGALLIGPITMLFALGVWYLHDQKASHNYMVTDLVGKAEPFHYDRIDNEFGLILVVALPCLVALAVAIHADHHHRRSLVAILSLLVLSTLGVVGGAVILRTEPGPVACEACLHPDWLSGSCEVSSGMSSHVDTDPVPCPASYQAGAERVVRAIDRQAIALIGLGGFLFLAGLVLLIRSWGRGNSTPEVSESTTDVDPSAADS